MYSDKKLLKELHRFYKKHGRVPRTRELKGDFPNASTYRNRFGSLRSALLEAGLPVEDTVKRPYSYNDEELITLINKAADILERVPSYSDFNKEGRMKNYPHAKTIENRFGSFQKALEVSGVLNKTFEDKIQKRIQEGEKIMESQIKPGKFKNVTKGKIFCTVGGKPTGIPSGTVVKLNEDDLAGIIDSEIIKLGLLLPTESDLSVDDSFNKNFYTDEAIERVLTQAEEEGGAERIRELLSDVTSLVTVSRFLDIMKIMDSPQSFVSACEERLLAIRAEEQPEGTD